MQVMPAVVNVMKEEATLVTLVKPQFEALRSQVRMLASIHLIFANDCPTWVLSFSCFLQLIISKLNSVIL